MVDEKDERLDEGACDEAEGRRLIERLKDKAVRKRRAWFSWLSEQQQNPGSQKK